MRVITFGKFNWAWYIRLSLSSFQRLLIWYVLFYWQMWGTMICKKQNHIRFANENCFRISLNSWRVPADSYVPWILLMDQRFWQTSQINNWQCLIWDSQVKIVEKLWVQNSLFAKRYLAREFRMDIELQMAQKELINCLNTYWRKCDKGWRNIVIWIFWICFI